MQETRERVEVARVVAKEMVETAQILSVEAEALREQVRATMQQSRKLRQQAQALRQKLRPPEPTHQSDMNMPGKNT